MTPNNSKVIENSVKIDTVINWQKSVDNKLDQIQTRQNIEMIVVFLSIASFFLTKI